jgi:hypothetical protein
MTLRRIRDYALAIRHSAGGQPLKLPWAALQVMRAKLGCRIGPFHFSLFGLARVPVSKWHEYIVMGPSFDARRNALSPNAIRGVVDNKILFYEHCVRAGLPAIPVICSVGRGHAGTDSAVEDVDDAERLAVLLKAAPSEIFAKPVSGAHGENVFRVVRSGGSFEFAGRAGSVADLFDRLQQAGVGGGGFILQPQVRPHAEILQWSSSHGLPTVRLVTVMHPEGPEILFACLRIPVGANVTDNFGTGTNGNLVAGIDIATGMLMRAYGSSRRDWPVIVEFARHPDTGCPFPGASIPYWREIVDVALRGQNSLPRVKTVGWDIAVTTSGVLLVELNSNYGVYTLQVAYQRGLKTELGSKLGISID